MPTDRQRNFLIPPTAEESAKRRDEAVAQIRHAYRFGVMVLGKEEAERQWRGASKKPGPGRPKGSTKPEQDKALLEFYDQVASNPDLSYPNLPKQIGMFLDDKCKGRFGATAAGVGANLRRLLRRRTEQDRAKAALRLKLREEAAARPRSPGNMLDPDWQNK
jgi:hypothetical protein